VIDLSEESSIDVSIKLDWWFGWPMSSSDDLQRWRESLNIFMIYDLGFFDHEAGRVECAENPFAAKHGF
jgi:hypothetical protein